MRHHRRHHDRPELRQYQRSQQDFGDENRPGQRRVISRRQSRRRPATHHQPQFQCLAGQSADPGCGHGGKQNHGALATHGAAGANHHQRSQDLEQAAAQVEPAVANGDRFDVIASEAGGLGRVRALGKPHQHPHGRPTDHWHQQANLGFQFSGGWHQMPVMRADQAHFQREQDRAKRFHGQRAQHTHSHGDQEIAPRTIQREQHAPDIS